LSTRRAPPTRILAAGLRVKTAVFVDASTNTSVVRIGVVGVRSGGEEGRAACVVPEAGRRD